jgi:hypothetical protein
MARVKRVTVFITNSRPRIDTEAGAPLVAELRLNLVEMDGQRAGSF